MTSKLHLPARPANEGARRLVWWMLNGDPAERAYARFMLHLRGVGLITLDRLIRGELMPGTDMAIRLSGATMGAVRLADWRDEAEGGWGEKPVERQHLRRAA